MAESSAESLDALQRLIEAAKAVPMSASCMINRADALALIETLRTAIAADLDAARADAEANPSVVERAKEQAAEVVQAAEEEAGRLVEATEVVEAARLRADELQQQAATEADAFRKEADIYVDGRIAAMEAGLQKTLSQIQTMRARLASRSGLDADAAES